MRIYIHNILWLLFDKVLRVFGGLFIGVWVARHLGPQDFGILNYAIAYSALFSLFSKIGLDQIIVREIVKTPKLTNYLLGTAFGLKLFGSFIALAFVFISLYFSDTDLLTKTVIFIVTAGFVFQSADIIDYFYQAKVLSKAVVVARNCAFILSTILNVYLLINDYSVIYFALSNLANLIFSAIFLFLMYKKSGYVIGKWRFSTRIAKKLLLYSWPLAISSFLIAIHLRVDQVMIGKMLSMEQVGLYSVAVRLAESWYFIPAILVSTFMPYFVRLREVDANLYQFRLIQLYFTMFWSGVGVSLVSVIYGDIIIKLLFGKEFEGSYGALVFNIWAGVFVAQSYAKGIWVISENLQIFRIFNNLIAIIVNISLNAILIPSYGISGAAAATLISRLINNWFSPLLFKPVRGNTILSIKSINPFFLIKVKNAQH